MTGAMDKMIDLALDADEQLLREAVVALRDRVHIPADRTCCPDCADDADAIDLITKLQERLLHE